MVPSPPPAAELLAADTTFYGRNCVSRCRWSYLNATAHYGGGFSCIICMEARRFRWSYHNAIRYYEEDLLCIICIEVFPNDNKCCKSFPADSVAHNRGPPLKPRDLCNELNTKAHRYYANLVK